MPRYNIVIVTGRFIESDGSDKLTCNWLLLD